MTLIKYLFKKILMLIPVLIGISIVAFALGVSSPGDPVDQVLNPTGDDTYTQEQYDAMAEKMGLDEPLPVQYLNWVKNLSRGDLGRSFFTQKSILEQLQKRIPLSMRLALYAMVLITVFGVGFGILMAMFKDSLLDHILGGICTVALSVPGFWIAIVLIYIFAEELKILPAAVCLLLLTATTTGPLLLILLQNIRQILLAVISNHNIHRSIPGKLLTRRLRVAARRHHHRLRIHFLRAVQHLP